MGPFPVADRALPFAAAGRAFRGTWPPAHSEWDLGPCAAAE